MLGLRSLLPFAAPATTSSGAVVVRDQDGERLAEARRRGSGPRSRWRWSATDPALGTFVVEPEGDQRSWLVTRIDGAPFGSLVVGGRLRHRLDITDGRGRRLTVSAWGAVRTSGGRKVARLRHDGRGRVALELREPVDATWRTLLLAATLVRPGN